MKYWIIGDEFIDGTEEKKAADAQGYLHELIRCKDCKYYTEKWCNKFSTKQFDINDICKADNDYCSMAERKEECTK